MSITILKVIALIGMLYCILLMLRKQKVIRLDPTPDPVTGLTGEELWQQGMQKKNLISTTLTGIVAGFFDALGVGCFAPATSAFKLTRSVDDSNIPGTLNVGYSIPACLEAILFLSVIKMDTLTLVSMIVASLLGAFLTARIAAGFDQKKVPFVMFAAMFLVAIITLCKLLQVGPFSAVGTAVSLSGVKLIIAIIVNFILGGLMTIGIGLYAPCMALCVLLGLNIKCAFPAMMGSCAYLMAFGTAPKFIQDCRYDLVGSWTQAIGGVIGVIPAVFLIGSMDTNTMTLIVVIVCFLTSLVFLIDGFRKRGSQK